MFIIVHIGHKIIKFNIIHVHMCLLSLAYIAPIREYKNNIIKYDLLSLDDV